MATRHRIAATVDLAANPKRMSEPKVAIPNSVVVSLIKGDSATSVCRIAGTSGPSSRNAATTFRRFAVA